MFKLQNWLNLPQGYNGAIWRLTGLVSMPISLVVWWWTHAGSNPKFYPDPYNVPTWWLKGQPLDLPLPPEAVNFFLFALFNIFALFMLFGKRWRLMPLFMSCFLFYYCSREYLISAFHWILLDWIFLCALALDSKGLSPTRRIIQVAIITCYIYGFTHRVLYPDFISGQTFAQYFNDGFACSGWCKDFFSSVQVPLLAWSVIAWFTLLVEVYIALALCYRQTRLSALVLGVLLHLGIAATMESILVLFTIEMLTGYLAFFEAGGFSKKAKVCVEKVSEAKRQAADEKGWACVNDGSGVDAAVGLHEAVNDGSGVDAAVGFHEAANDGSGGDAAVGLPGNATVNDSEGMVSGEGASSFRETVPPWRSCGGLVIVLIEVLMPTRIYLFPDRPVEQITLLERTPWTFGMFILRQKVKEVLIEGTDAQGKSFEIKPYGRYSSMIIDNELRRAVQHLLQENPHAQSIKAWVLVEINGHRLLLKNIRAERGQVPSVVRPTTLEVNAAAVACGLKRYLLDTNCR